MKFKSIKNVKDLKGKKILYRVAYDITLTKKGKSYIVPDNRRIKETLPTIEYLLKKGASLVIMSWLKRPDGKVVKRYRMDPVARELSKLIGKPVKKVDDCIGVKVQDEINKLKPGKLLMLENVRFHKEEMTNNSKFAKQLTKGLDLIVFDAFAQSHRIHASTTGIQKYLPTYTGLLLEKEITILNKIIKNHKKPLTIVLGGAKISDKLNVLKFLVKKADYVLIGGALANVFYKAKGMPIGKSYIQDVFVDSAKRKRLDLVKVSGKMLKKDNNIILPVDGLAASSISEKATTRNITFLRDDIKSNELYLDIGPKTIRNYLDIISKSKTILFNGPMGYFEINKFSIGTRKISKAIAKSSGLTIVGGGDTENILKEYNLGNKFNHVSTGGGAMLEYLEGKTLPALKKLIK